MAPAAGTASLDSLLDTLHEIEPVLRAHSADAERERRLPPAVAAAMRDCGLYRMWRPKALGGLELDPVTLYQVLEAVARIDAAAGWNLTLSCTVDAFGAWFQDDGAEEIFGGPDATFSGSFFPFRRAVAVDGGYRVTGQTPFNSGAHNAKWFIGLAHVYDGATPRLGPGGAPQTIFTMCPAGDGEILDTWRTMGMRGTGSHDVIMSDVFVPSRRAAPLAPYERPASAYQGPLYKLTVWAAIASLATVPLGIARTAIDELLALAGRKTPSYLATPLRDRIDVQAAIGEAEATLGAGRAYLYEALREGWEKALVGHLIDMPGKMKLQLAASHAVTASARAVDIVHKVAGTTGVREEHRFERHYRDIHTVEHHAYVSAGRYESGGQYFLGRPIEWPFYGL
jgi:indole-3-acetate monooxygenase